MKGIFFQNNSSTTDNSIENPQFACVDNCFISKRLRSIFLVTGGTALIFVDSVTIKMAKIRQNRGALHSAQWRVPTNFILYVSTFMLVLLSYH